MENLNVKLETNVDKNILEKASTILARRQMTIDEAINLFLQAVVANEDLPFNYVNLNRPRVIDARGMDHSEVLKMLGIGK